MQTLVYPKVLTRAWWHKRKSPATEKTGLGAQIEKLEKAWAKSPAAELLALAELELEKLALTNARDFDKSLDGFGSFVEQLDTAIKALQAADRKISDKDSKLLLKELLEAARQFEREATKFETAIEKRYKDAQELAKSRVANVDRWVAMSKEALEESDELLLQYMDEGANVEKFGKPLRKRLYELWTAKKKMDKAEYARAAADVKRVLVAVERMSQIKKQFAAKAKAFAQAPAGLGDIGVQRIVQLKWSPTETLMGFKTRASTFERSMTDKDAEAYRLMEKLLKLVKP